MKLTFSLALAALFLVSAGSVAAQQVRTAELSRSTAHVQHVKKHHKRKRHHHHNVNHT